MDSTALQRMAERARDDADLLASCVARFRDATGLDWAGAASRLGIGAEQLARLALCQRPAPRRFDNDVSRIAAYVGIPPEQLARMLAVLDPETASYAAQTGRKVRQSHPAKASHTANRRQDKIMVGKALRWGLVALGILLVAGMALARPDTAQATLVVAEGSATLAQNRPVLLLFSSQRTISVGAGEAIDLRAGDRVVMDEDGAAQVLLVDGSVIDLYAGTEMDLSELAAGDDALRVRAQVAAGRTYYRIQRILGIDDIFEVQTPSSAASVRGTAFAVEVLSPVVSYYACDEGTVLVRMGDQEVTLNAGDELYAVAGQDLLPEPQGSPEEQPGVALISPLEPPAAGSTVTVRGYTSAGSEVTVAGAPVPVDENGYFEAQVVAGSAPIIVEATRPGGNTVSVAIETR